MTTSTRYREWAEGVARDCLAAANGDDEAAAVALEIFLSTQPMPDETEVDPPESPDDDWREEADPIGTSDGKPVDRALSTDAQGHEHKGKGPGGGQFARTRIVGEDWHGKLVSGTTEKSAKHFIAGTDLPEGDRSKTYSEWGSDVIYASDHDAPHQALMFASHRSVGAGGKRLMVEFQLKQGSKVIDLSDELTRRPAWGFGGPEIVVFKDGKRPSFTDDMVKWLEEKRAAKGARQIDVRQYIDPEHEGFSLSEYLPLLKSYAKDRGFAAVRLHDETVIVDRTTIQSARKMTRSEVEELRKKPRLRKPYKGGGLYSEFKENEASLSIEALLTLRDKFARAAQEEYDAWQPTEEEGDPEVGFGGICDRISNSIADIIVSSFDDAETYEGGQAGDDHAYTIVRIGSEYYGIDIDPHVYESGGGYNWKKIPDVTIMSRDIDIWKIEGYEPDDQYLSVGLAFDPKRVDAFFAFDIHNRQAQGILNRSLQAVRGLSRAAREDLMVALKKIAAGHSDTILDFIDKYRVKLARVLTNTQLAALLEGAREVATKVPPLGEVPVEGLPVEEQERIIQAGRNRQPPIEVGKVGGGAPEDIHYVTIDEAVKNLQQRNVLDKRAYDALEASARAKAFTVANVQAEETLTKIRDSLAQNMKEGVDYNEWKNKVVEDAEPGTFMSDAHQETVFRTNIQTALSDGQYTVVSHPLVRSGFPYVARDAIHDDRVRHNHLALEKLGIGGTNVYRTDDPVWQLFRVPWDYNDRCGDTFLTVRQAAEKGVKEAQVWLETGVEPAVKAWVKMPDFRPPPEFQRSVSAAPLSIQLSLHPTMSFSTDKKPEEEPDTAELYGTGTAEVGGIHSATLDTAKEGKSKTKVKVLRAKTKKGKKVRRSLFKRLRIKRRWRPVALSAALGQWITIGGEPDPATGEKHVGGFKVFVDQGGRILKGKMAGTNIRDVKSKFDRMKGGKASGQQRPSPGVRRGGGGVPGRPQGASGPVAGAAPRPGDAKASGVGTGQDIAARAAADGNARVAAKAARAKASAEAKESLDKVNRRLDKYANHFRGKGQEAVAEWMGLLKEHINEMGVEDALGALRDLPGPTTDPITGKVQYKGTGVFGQEGTGVSTAEAAFLSGYLSRNGIVLQTSDNPNPMMPVIASAPLPAGTPGIKPGSFVPPEYSSADDKLKESKSLPGLETSEDIHKVIGKRVTHFTPEVIAKLDATYGKGKWLTKPYGDEAFASFGVYFPQRIKEMQKASRQTLWDTGKKLGKYGYSLARDESGNCVGVKKGGKVYKFGSLEFTTIPNKNVRKLGGIASTVAPSEKAARLPVSPEINLQQNYGILLRKGTNGSVVGVTLDDGKNIDITSPEWKKVQELDEDIGHHIERSIMAVDSGQADDPRIMVQPAFAAVGVTEEDRAEGATFETAQEGRVHVVTRNGKVSVVPYATLARRGDTLPVTFYNQDILDMEKAVHDAISSLPDADRTGQVYSPDVMRTKDGWRVVEVNAATEGAQSLWLEENPFVIDAFVSHMTGGREPSHVKFIRNLLGERVKVTRSPTARGQIPQQPTTNEQPQIGGGKEGVQLSFDEDKHPRAMDGTFTRKGGGQSKVRTIRHGSLRVKYVTYRQRSISGPHIPFKNYVQMDEHSCGFVAALTIARHFNPTISSKEVLATIRPSVSGGIDGKTLRKRLNRIGVKTAERGSLDIDSIRRHIENNTPVLVTIWPDEWVSDHWVVINGLSEDGERIYLTNYHSMSVKDFNRIWYTKGYGLICAPTGKPSVTMSVEEPMPTGDKLANATADNMPDTIYVSNAKDQLHAIVVGRPDNDVIPRWYPTFDGKDSNEVDDPSAVGKTKKEYNPEMFKRAVKQTNALCKVLEEHGVRVFRPPLIPLDDAKAEPVGLAAEWTREVFTVIGTKLIVNQPRAAHRNKDHQALEPFFAALEATGKCTVHRLPPCDWQRKDNDLHNDPRPFLEGGDIFRLDKNVIVTISYMASSPTGFRWLSDLLAPDGIEVWPAYLTKDWEHGDYIFRPVRDRLCLAYLPGFVDGLLPTPCADWDVIALTKEEADKKFAANGISIHDDLILIPAGNPRVVGALKKKGVECIEVPFDGPTYWQGGIDCATTDLWRGDKPAEGGN